MFYRPSTPAAYKLIHEGVLAFADMEQHGIRVDTDYLAAATTRVRHEIAEIEEKLKNADECREWRKVFGTEFNWDSKDQLAHVLHEVFKYPCHARTPTGKHKMDVERLEMIDRPFVAMYIKRANLMKLDGTYLQGIARNVAHDGILHPFFNLHTTISFRSSSDTPNFQNIPVRDEHIMQIIRQAFIAWDCDYVLVEIDYSSAEVRVAACYHKDPTMLQYIEDDYDLHTDMSIECFLLPPGTKKGDIKLVRNLVKGSFVFAEFYGSWYKSVAESLWEQITQYKLCAPDGTPMKAWLKSKGITGLGTWERGQQPARGTFYAHIKAVEDNFWNVRFPVYGQWRKDIHNQYLRDGYLETLTGFTVHGVLDRNQVINIPTQGSAFHCLLNSVIEINRETKRRKMRSRVVGQIHDSIMNNVHVSELDEFITMAKQIMTKDLRRKWSWVITPMEVEADVTPPGGNWAAKKAYKVA